MTDDGGLWVAVEFVRRWLHLEYNWKVKLTGFAGELDVSGRESESQGLLHGLGMNNWKDIWMADIS